MAHSYTPGLKVLKSTEILKERRLPLKGQLECKTGDSVKPDDIVAKTDLPGNVQMINVANQLNIDASDIENYMIKAAGESINKDDLMAETKGLFGFFKSSVFSPVDGTIESISNVTGQVVLRESPIPVEVDAYVKGEIHDIIPDEGVVIKTNGVFIQGIFGIGGESRGRIKTIVDDRNTEITAEMITDDEKGNIIIGGNFIGLEGFKKAINCEVAGIVVGGFNYYDLDEILGYTLGVAITGSEEIITSLIVTEGYGKIQMSQQTFDLLKSHDGKFASVNGATQIRAGVIRPEIIIPINKSAVSGEQSKETLGMMVGSLVRVIRSPNFGKIGTVKLLPSELRKMESETLVRTASVEIDGDTFEIPRSNLEVVETD
ncbi:MAG: hypothetical protein CMG69_00825 [Candidatus Marinimicrobia bacterium]|nr:hypothetical protein [Candidatus Neomarinimicrobiota bacterium]|tara:strand:- start:13629 stop:14750 length:1122 start_codon:yes stop_codon:yes gene_type:complete